MTDDEIVELASRHCLWWSDDEECVTFQQAGLFGFARTIEARTIERCAGLHSALESGILPPNQTEFIAGYEQGIEDYYQSILSLKGVAE